MSQESNNKEFEEIAYGGAKNQGSRKQRATHGLFMFELNHSNLITLRVRIHDYQKIA